MIRECCELHGVKTGMVQLTMPVKHERQCNECGEIFWCLPEQMGESYSILPRPNPQSHDGEGR